MEKCFECLICLEIMTNSVEFLCCFSTACEECAQMLDKCPICNKALEFRASIQIRRLIGALPINCDFCQYATNRGNLPSHLKSCPKRPEKCGICGVLVNATEKLNHALQFHLDDIIKIYNYGSLPKASEEEKKVLERDCINLSKKARIGKTGKYYCGKSLGSISCACCDGFCGKIAGCNCVECMKLDLEARGLPKGYLVNSIGNICTKNNSGKVVCLCLVEVNKRCGENYQCGYCAKIEKVWHRYQSLLN